MSIGDPKELIPEQCTSGYSYMYLSQIGTFQVVSNGKDIARINTVTGESCVLHGAEWIKIKE